MIGYRASTQSQDKRVKDAWTQTIACHIIENSEAPIATTGAGAQDPAADSETSLDDPAGGRREGQLGNRKKGGCHRLTVKQWRERWLALEPIPLEEVSVEERLEDLPRPGGPPRITADQRCQLEALACEAPEQSGRPISQWTGREIADEMMARQIVDTISPRHAARLLKRSINSSSSESLLVEHRKG